MLLHCLGGSDDEHKHRVFPSQLQSLLAATDSLVENLPPLLQYWLSLTRFESQKLFEMERRCYRLQQRSLLSSLLNLSIFHWTKSSYSKLTAADLNWQRVQERASAQILIERHSNSDGGTQILGNNVRHDSESIKPKFSAKSVANEMLFSKAM